MPQSKKKPCPLCIGQKVIPTPDGTRHQLCPLCEGHGSQYDPGLFYSYRTTPVTVSGNASNTQIISVVNWDFRWLMLTGTYTGIFTFNLTDLGTGRVFSNIAIHENEMVGTGQNPFPIPVPYEFMRNTQIQVQLTDLSGNNNLIDLCFIGVNLGEAAHE